MSAGDVGELDQLVVDLRRQWGDRLPVPRRDESAAERDEREAETRNLLTRVVIPEFDLQRMSGREAPLTDEQRSAVVDLVISEMFGLPRLLTVLRDPMVTDVLVFGSDPVRVERSDGSREFLPPLVRRDRDLERIIYDVASARSRSFNREHPFVDLELEPGVRFHGEGFDVVQRPLVTVRRAAVFGMTLHDLHERGMLDACSVALLRAAVAADMNVLVCGRMGSGKTTLLRSLLCEVDEHDVVVTVETDFELNVSAMGRHRFVHAYQSRLPSTSDGRGISCHDVMVPALRTRADWIVVGEIRGSEGAALVQAMSIGQGAMATVHGGSAKDGLERLAELIAAHGGIDLRMARWQVYRSVDLVVHVTGDNQRGRWVTEIAAPSVEDDGGRFVVHRIVAPRGESGDTRGRPASEPQRLMTSRLVAADPRFTTAWWHDGAETHRPLRRGAAPLVAVGGRG